MRVERRPVVEDEGAAGGEDGDLRGGMIKTNTREGLGLTSQFHIIQPVVV